jgi:ABC-type maltose transport system permease subunit
VFIGPFLIQLATSFKTDADAANNSLSLIPHPATLSAWKRIFGFTENAGIPLRPVADQQHHRGHVHHAGAGVPGQPGRVRAGKAAVPGPAGGVLERPRHPRGAGRGAGAALLSTIPVAIVFFAFQRHFIGGQLTAAIKG